MSDKGVVKSFLPVIDKWLNFQTYIEEIPSVSVGIFLDDEVIFTKSYGYANVKDKTPATPQTMYRIASHSKVFTSTLIMQLYEQGLLSIDDKINKYLSWLPPQTSEIRIRHLLTHSSGLTRDFQFGQWFHHNFPNKDEFISALNQESTIFEPNLLFKYSNIAFTLLGFIVEEVSHKSFQQNIMDLTQQLGMKNTIFDYSDEFGDYHATGYTRKVPHESRQPFDHVQAKSMSSATGLSSNVDDLLLFYQAHFLGNGKLFSDIYKRDMQQIHFVDSKKNLQWGLGFNHMNISDFHFNGHGGGYPGFITRSGFDQEKKLIIVALTNAIDGPALDLFTGIANWIHFAIKNKDKFNSSNQFPYDAKFNGYYRNNWRICFLQKVKDVIVLVNPLFPIIDQSINILEQTGADTFILPEGSGFDNAGEVLSLHVDNESIFLRQAGENIEKFDIFLISK